MSFPATNDIFPSNHKTIFVLDHTPYFGISGENPIEFEFLIKSRTPGCVPMAPISKSLWTSSVESAIEYCRIVWDLFPQGKLVRFVASDTVAHILNTWSPNQQNMSHIMNAMSLIGVPPPPTPVRNLDYTVLHGLRAAIEALSECTEIQVERKKFQQSSGDLQSKLVNKCRVICITSARDNDSMKRLEEIFLSVLQQQNKVTAGSDRLLTIDHCHLVIINTFPVNVEPQVNNHPPKHLSPILTTEVHSIKASLISNKLSSLILDHYNLASTTVTGIPMKEEQNASSSANYDVEIYHSNAAHFSVLKGHDTSQIRTIKEGLDYETVTLKWCTPRGFTGTELQNCTSMHRITPVDVNSRPSLCLINFLLNGRSVMLEMLRKPGDRITSHLLAAHGGEIFIHTLCTARSVLEDPPSISEGCGGRVTDYRITDFGLVIKQNTLVPVKPNYLKEYQTKPILKMKNRLARLTKYWPLTISSTLIFNLKGYIDPLPALITKEKLTEEELFQCKRVIVNLISLESHNETLYPVNAGQRFKGMKREEQYKAIWNELDTLLKNNLHSPEHRSVYNSLLEYHKFNFDEEKLNEKVELDEALRELDQIGPSASKLLDPHHPAQQQDAPRASVIRATTDSPMSPPPLASISTPPVVSATNGKTPSSVNNNGNAAMNSTTGAPAAGKIGGIYSAQQRTFFDIVVSQEKVKYRPEFAGRSGGGGGNVAKLYANTKVGGESAGPRGDNSIEVE